MAGRCMDLELTRQLASLVETLSTTGNPSLDAAQMKKLKNICKTSDLYVQHAHGLVMRQLSTEHAEVRLSTFQIIDELFNRSHAFRELLVSNFQRFLELTVETDQQHQPLPPPKAVAQKLKSDTLKAIQQWQDKFGSAYKKLSLGYHYLQTCKEVNFNDIRARTIAEQRRKEQQEQRKQKALAAKLEKARKEIEELRKEIFDTATEAENCIELLLPKPESLFDQADFVTTEGKDSSESSDHVKSCSRPAVSSSDLPTAAVSNCEQTLPRLGGPTKSELCESTNNPQQEHCENTEVAHISHHSKDSEETKQPGSRQLNCDTSENANSPNKNSPNSNGSDDSDSDCDDVEEEEGDYADLDADEAEEKGLVRTHGLGSRKYNLQIEIETSEVRLTETEDNRDLFHSLKDSSRLIAVRHLPQVVKWLEVLSKTGGSEQELKTLIDLKVRLEHIKSQCTELQLVPQSSSQGEQSDSDEELQEVPEKEGYEPVIPAHLRAEYGLDPIPPSGHSASSKSSATSGKGSSAKSGTSRPTTAGGSSRASASKAGTASAAHWSLVERHQAAPVQDPASRAASLSKLGLQDDRPSTSSGKSATVTSESSGQVPTLSFGLDLAYWGTPDKIEAPAVVKNDSLHRFWVPAEVEHEKASQGEIAAVMNRTFHYTGQFVPVKWKCRAKLPSGKLCERMDRYKCPFHGKIIARDENGCPSNPSDIKVEVKEEDMAVETEKVAAGSEDDKDEVPPWLDAELQADIERATGHDLGSQRSKAIADKAKGLKGKGRGKGRGKGKKKYEGLTDIKASKNTTRARLEAKVFNKTAMKRVASALDAADYKRVRDKFGNQFNYAYKN